MGAGAGSGMHPAAANDVGASLGAFQAAVDRGRRASRTQQSLSPAPSTGTDLFPS